MRIVFSCMAIAIVASCGGSSDDTAMTPEVAWEKVSKILAETKDLIVLDGVERSELKYQGSEQPGRGDWVVRHFLSDPENFNPFTSNDSGASTVNQYIFQTLLYPQDDPPFTLRGEIATGYPTVSEDGLTYEFEIRDNVRFADGEPLSAQDVLFSFKVAINPKVLAPHLRNYLASIQNIEIIDGTRVRFTCSEPYFQNDLVIGGYVEMIPRHFYDPNDLLADVSITSLIDGSWEEGPQKDLVERFAENFNTTFNRKSMGSGPYHIADWEADVVTGQKVALSYHDDYWGTHVDGLRPPGFVDKIVFNIINDMDAAFIELVNGNLDYFGLRALQFKDKSWSPEIMARFKKGVYYPGGYTYIGWNNAHPIFKDRRVRQAMSHLTNRGSMVENLLFGLAETVEGPIHPFRPEYNPNLKAHAFDPDLGLELLEEAGWQDTDNDGILDKMIDGEKVGFKFDFLVNSGNQLRKDVALTLQNELQDIGIVCEILELDWSIFLDRVKSKDFHAITLGWTGSLRFPPDAYQIWHSSQAEGTGSNFISFKNEEVDGILEAYRNEFDAEKRIAAYQRFQEILHEEQPYTFLWSARGAIAYSRRYKGVNWYPAGANIGEWFVTPNDQVY
jgi:peptide/nickel transport system substrate-binding protein